MGARIACLGAAAVIAAVDVLHLYVELRKDESDAAGGASVFALALATAAGLTVAGAFVHERPRRFGFLGTAVTLTLVLAVVSGFSVGPLLVPAVVMLLYGMFSA
ncbi:MAG: hypothetical protein H0V79_12690 [Actinobacteria bacterium]|nr:hypothetical protein [Actinomycetota bacterium]